MGLARARPNRKLKVKIKWGRRAPGGKTEVLCVDAWWRRILEDVRAAKAVRIATFIYDHPGLQAELLRRLGGHGAFALSVVVDKEGLEERVSVHQRPRLLELQRAGAEVRVGRGLRRMGRLHAKALCVDGRAVYTGSANLTKKSTDNEELCLRLTGRPAAQVATFVGKVTANARLWDGA